MPPSNVAPGTGSADTGRIVLGRNQYGKAEVRLVRITRDADRHSIEDLNVTSQLHGDFAAAHTDGDNSNVVATDTQKNTVYAFAKDGVGSLASVRRRMGGVAIDWLICWVAAGFAAGDDDGSLTDRVREVTTGSPEWEVHLRQVLAWRKEARGES